MRGQGLVVGPQHLPQVGVAEGLVSVQVDEVDEVVGRVAVVDQLEVDQDQVPVEEGEERRWDQTKLKKKKRP